MIIRGDTIKYSSIKKIEMYKEEQDLELQIKAIEDDINSDVFIYFYFFQINNDQLNILSQKKKIRRNSNCKSSKGNVKITGKI